MPTKIQQPLLSQINNYPLRCAGLADEDSDILLAEEERYEEFKTAIRKVGRFENIRNASAVLVKISDIVREHYERQEKAAIDAEYTVETEEQEANANAA